MGAKQSSIYEKPGTMNYYQFSAKEYGLVKNVWSRIEVNPLFHGNAFLKRTMMGIFSFCTTYPQYVKFFTLELRLNPMNVGAITMLKFSVIMETIGYLLLDFNKKPKKLDRLVAYIAMVHKDMQLDEEDLNNFMSALIDYLLRTYPMHMTTQCQEAMSKFMNSVVHELFAKMRLFRDYDVTLSNEVIRSPWGLCPFFAEPPIFGKTRLYWDQKKNQWDARLDEWTKMTYQDASTPAEAMKMRSDDFDDENDFSKFQSRATKGNDDDVDDSISRKRVVTSDARRLSAQRRLRMSLPSLAYSPQKLLEAARDPRERYRLKSEFYLQDLNEIDRENNDTEQPDDENDRATTSRLTARERHRRKLQRQSEMKK